MGNDYVVLNRRSWDQDAENLVESGRERWAMDEPTWGWGHQESELRLLPELNGLDAVELGCGTAFISAWLTRAGAHVVGIDNSSSQLATASKLQAEFHSDFPLVQADAEVLPFPDASFDFAISEFGAATWCDPYRRVPEAARVLRPGGRLVACSLTAFAYVCFPLDDDEAPADMALHRDYFGMHRFEWRDASGEIDYVDFHIG
jgi:ubiquinone/menaquinone biosynthesis C-methylase UbiE